MDKWHTVIAGMGVVLFLLFALPLLTKGIINIGNITGMLLGLLVTGYGVFYLNIHQWVIKVWQRSVGKALLTLVLIVLGLIFLVVIAETVGMVCAANNAPPQNTTAIVLGCSVKGEKPSRILQERLDAAYDYLTENPSALCVLSGGQGKGEDISEAECMYRYLMGKGIEKERLLCEDASVNTEENLMFSRKLLEEHGILGDVTLVTSEFHAYRATKTVERLGMCSYSTPSHTSLLYLPTYYVRELYGILYYIMK